MLYTLACVVHFSPIVPVVKDDDKHKGFLGKNFTFNMTEIKEFGVQNEDGSWTGIMELLRKNELDVAIADLTPTDQRSLIADFSIGLRRSDFLLFQATSKDHFNWEIYKNVFSDKNSSKVK